MLSAAFGYDTIKFVQIRVEIKYCRQVTKSDKGYPQQYNTQLLRMHSPLTATHSMTSTYFGSMTIVLKLPLTRADSTNGLHRYRGFDIEDPVGDGGTGGGGGMSDGKAPVGVGDRFGPRGARLMERLNRT